MPKEGPGLFLAVTGVPGVMATGVSKSFFTRRSLRTGKSIICLPTTLAIPTAFLPGPARQPQVVVHPSDH